MDLISRNIGRYFRCSEFQKKRSRGEFLKRWAPRRGSHSSLPSQLVVAPATATIPSSSIGSRLIVHLSFGCDGGATSVSSCIQAQQGTAVPTGPLSLHSSLLDNGPDDTVDGLEYHIFCVPVRFVSTNSTSSGTHSLGKRQTCKFYSPSRPTLSHASWDLLAQQRIKRETATRFGSKNVSFTSALSGTLRYYYHSLAAC